METVGPARHLHNSSSSFSMRALRPRSPWSFWHCLSPFLQNPRELGGSVLNVGLVPVGHRGDDVASDLFHTTNSFFDTAVLFCFVEPPFINNSKFCVMQIFG